LHPRLEVVVFSVVNAGDVKKNFWTVCVPYLAPIIDKHIPHYLFVPGIKLKTLTQSLAYKIIRAQKMESAAYQEALDRDTTSKNIIYVCARCSNRL
jgi:hypothetical protein